VRLVHVAVPVPGLGPLTYSVPDGLPDPPVGARVLVPLGRRVMTGIVLVSDPNLTADQGTDPKGTTFVPKPLVDVVDSEPFLPPDVVEIATWVADYYACGIGEAIATAMPPRAWIESERRARITERGEAERLRERGTRRDVLDALTGGRVVAAATLLKRRGLHDALTTLERDGFVTLTQPLRGRADASRTVRVAVLTAQGTDEIDDSKLGVRQRTALDLLRGAPDGIAVASLAEQGIASTSIARLVRLGLASVERRRVERDPFQDANRRVPTAADLTLTDEQSGALEQLSALASAGEYRAALLHGVTGSGKTEIYLRLARAVQASGRSVLLMVPEIALTPAASMAFRRAFGGRVAIQHSGLSDGERYDQWQRIRRGDVDVVVGTRSAVFAPLASLGLIVVDEEHDGSYKQEESPRYNGRDVAVVRARNACALVVLGSATPSLESYFNAENSRYVRVTLPNRVLARPMADVRVVDMREEFAARGPDVILSSTLQEGLAARLERGEQAIVLLNRRGFATSVFCRECAATLDCPNCSVSLTVHKAAGRARCHYCNYSRPLPKVCAVCAGPFLEQLGFGTERVEAEIAAAFPAARIGRVDRDTIRRRGAIAGILSRFADGELDVLIGTQMIAKGHDFPRVTLVGVISADVGLGLADFRAAERTFQLLTQVAGRAGRGERAGEAVIQTLYPNHYSIQHACRQDYCGFYRDELVYRRAMRYPPDVALINVLVKARTRQGAMDDAGEIATALRTPAFGYRVLGPAPAPLVKLKGEHRAQLFVKGTQRNAMRKALVGVLADRPELKRRVVIDVDPMSVL
jgi:primosomal protein N' (replication factor Y) (superfamily II helicase)